MIPTAKNRNRVVEFYGKKTEVVQQSLEIGACKVKQKTRKDRLDPMKRIELAETQRYVKGGLTVICTPFNN